MGHVLGLYALTCLEELRSDLYKIFSKHKNTPPLIYICGDFNLGDIDWSDMTTTNPQTAKYHDKLFEILDEFGLQNVQKEATRPASGKCLDFVITNMPTTINSLEVVPGISDHHAVSFDISVKPRRANKPPHKVYLYKNSNQDAMKADIRDLCDEFFAQNPDKRTVNENWTFFKEKLKSLIEKHIPSKLTRSKRSLPGITRPIVRMQRKRSLLLKIAKQTKKTKHMDAFKSFRNKDC